MHQAKKDFGRSVRPAGDLFDQDNPSDLKELFDTNREFLVNQAGSVVEAQRQMMQFARMSVDNPVQLAEHILRAWGGR